MTQLDINLPFGGTLSAAFVLANRVEGERGNKENEKRKCNLVNLLSALKMQVTLEVEILYNPSYMQGLINANTKSVKQRGKKSMLRINSS